MQEKVHELQHIMMELTAQRTPSSQHKEAAHGLSTDVFPRQCGSWMHAVRRSANHNQAEVGFEDDTSITSRTHLQRERVMKPTHLFKSVRRMSSKDAKRQYESKWTRLQDHYVANGLYDDTACLKLDESVVSIARLDEQMLGVEVQGDQWGPWDNMDIDDSDESSIVTTALSDRIIIDAMDEDALPVDHPRRTYDVVDFLHRWRSSTPWHVADAPQHPDVLQFARSRQQSLQIRRPDLHHSNLDMQGVDWSAIATSKQDILAARAVLHPSRIAAQARRLNLRSEQDLVSAQCERHYRFANFHPQSKVHVSHFQLRHLVGASDRSAIYCANGSGIVRTSLTSPCQDQAAIKVAHPPTFKITCLTTSPVSAFADYHTDNVLVAGGYCGEYALLDLAQEQQAPVAAYVAPGENGLVTHVHTSPARQSGALQAVFCTNNHQVRTLDTRTLQWKNTFTYHDAVNCSATSPDHRLRVLAGDSNTISIADAERGDTHVTLTGHTDHAFACAWSPDGRFVATGSEDTTVRIWDSRNWSRSLATLPSVQTCPRSLHFTPDSRALVVAENEDVVSIHDLPAFTNRQDIRFFGAVAGIAVLDDGAELVVANADPTLGGLLAFQRTRSGFAKPRIAFAGGLMDDVVV